MVGEPDWMKVIDKPINPLSAMVLESSIVLLEKFQSKKNNCFLISCFESRSMRDRFVSNLRSGLFETSLEVYAVPA